MKLTHYVSIRTILAVLTVAISLALPAYLYVATQQARAFIEESRASIQEDHRREAASQSITRLLEETADNRTRLGGHILSADMVATFIGNIEALGSVTKTAIEIGAVSLKEESGAFNTVSVTLQARGSFSGVYRVLELVETLPYALSIDSVVFGGEKGEWAATLTLSVPVHKK